MNDAYRNQCYKRAINKATRPNDLVLDIGTGSGLLALYASDAGAGKVVACEANKHIADAAKDNRSKPKGDIVSVIPKKSQELLGRLTEES